MSTHQGQSKTAGPTDSGSPGWTSGRSALAVLEFAGGPGTGMGARKRGTVSLAQNVPLTFYLPAGIMTTMPLSSMG